MDYTTWRHAFKLDPAKSITDEALRTRSLNRERMVLLSAVQTGLHWTMCSIYSFESDVIQFRLHLKFQRSNR